MTLPWTFNVDLLFERKFTFRCDGFLKLDSIDGHFLSSPLWEFVDGTRLKNGLDEVLSQLRRKDPIAWGEHASRTELVSFVMPTIRKLILNITNELFTRDWCKLMEILMTFPVIDLESQSIKDNGFNGLFLCEAPGSFVHAAHHYIKSTRPETPFNWLASTLNIYYEQMDMIRTTIGDDRFIQCQSTYGNWFFGEDDRGDLLDIDMIKQICNKYKDSGADLVTADGGISCVDEPDKQEEKSFPLIFHQFITAINCLKPGGSLVLKMFNLFSSQSLSLVYLANSLFDQVHCFKPVHVDSEKSEVYLVCINLLFRKRNLIKTITSQYFDKSLSSSYNILTSSVLDQSLIPSSFIQQFTECSKLFTEYQKSTIIQNLEFFDNPNRQYLYDALIPIKKIVARVYTTERFPPEVVCDQLTRDHDFKVPEFNRFAYSQFSLSDFVPNDKKRREGSSIKLMKIFETLENLYDHQEVETLISSWTTISDSIILPTIKMNFGRPYTKLSNSRFIDKNLLHLYNVCTSGGEKLIKMQFDGYTRLSRIRTKSRIISIINSRLESDKTGFGRIIGPESSFIPQNLSVTLSALSKEPQDLRLGSLNGDRNMIVIDPYDYSDTPQCCGPSNSGNFTIIEREQDLIENIIDQLIQNLHRVRSFDFLAIHSCSILSRLMVQLIFLLTVIFKQISIIPDCSFDRVTNTEAGHSNIQTFQLGQLIVLTNSNRQSTEFVAQRDRLILVLKQIKSAFVEARDSGKMLLEIFPIVNVFTNSSFCEVIFTGNFIHLTDRMRALFEFVKYSGHRFRS